MSKSPHYRGQLFLAPPDPCWFFRPSCPALATPRPIGWSICSVVVVHVAQEHDAAGKIAVEFCASNPPHEYTLRLVEERATEEMARR